MADFKALRHSLEWRDLSANHPGVGGAVTALLERMLATGQLTPGDKLPPEREMAAALGVSRGSVRDALSELAMKGLIERRPALGTTVRAPSSDAALLRGALDVDAKKMLDIVDVRRIVEPAVCQRAAERATPAEIEALRQNLEETYFDLSPEEIARLDREFHLLLARASQNEFLIALMSAVSDMIHSFRVTSQKIDENRATSINSHRRIFDAVRRGDGEAAHAAMTSHILNIGEMMLKRHASAVTTLKKKSRRQRGS
jgi:GntR family transcriptional repressor for pyruvate dehydrogenase complex